MEPQGLAPHNNLYGAPMVTLQRDRAMSRVAQSSVVKRLSCRKMTHSEDSSEPAKPAPQRRPIHVSIANWQHSRGLAEWITAITNVFSAVASAAAVIGLVFVYLTLQATRESTDSANRAWLEVRDVDFSPAFDHGQSRTSASIVNLGGEPAQNVRMSLLVGFQNTSTIDSAPFAVFPTSGLCDDTRTHPRGIVYHDDPLKLKFMFPANRVFTNGSLRNDVASKLHHGNSVLSYQGCLTYVTRHQLHHTLYCDYVGYNPLLNEVALRLCPLGNSAD